MDNNRLLRRAAAIVVPLVLCWSTPSSAATQRTFVASIGNDSNPCSLTQPCRGFAAAVSKTAAGGEVIVLDSAGYGPVTITQSVSIVAARGIYAGITAFSGAGISVHGTGVSVALKGLKINGQGADTGIDFDLGSMLLIEDCEVSNIAGTGIHAHAPGSHTTIRNTVVRNNQDGIIVHGLSPGIVRATITDSLIVDNSFDGVLADSNSGTTVQTSVFHSVLTGNQTGAEIIAVTNAPASIWLKDTTVSFSATGLQFFSTPQASIFTSGDNGLGYVGTPIGGGGIPGPCCAL